MKYVLWLSAAQGFAPPGGDQGGGGMIGMLFPMAAVFLLYYFLLHLPQKKRQEERQKMLEAVKRGDEVMTSGGILGTVQGVTDKIITLEIAPKVRIKVTKAHVTELVTKSDGSDDEKKKSKDGENHP